MIQEGRGMDVEIREMPAMRVAAVPHAGRYQDIGKAFERLGSVAGPSGLLLHPGSAMIGIYYDDPDATPPEKLRSEAAIVVPEHVPLPEGLVEQRIPEGRYARAVHVGPYEQLPDAWARLKGEALAAGGHRIGTRPSYEIYTNDPSRVPKDELRTELYIPLA
jgi:AraC family transcriptional regulator